MESPFRTGKNPPGNGCKAPLDPYGRPLEPGRVVHYRLPGWPAAHWEHGHVAATRKFARGHQARILAALAEGPGTKDDVAERCGLTDQQVIRRMADLRRKGLVSPGTGSGRSVTGNRETVWRLTEPVACSCSPTGTAGPPGLPLACACGQSR